MAPDLLAEYFERDFSEAELVRLEKALESEDECLRFAKMAALAYAAFHLPKPRIPGKGLGTLGNFGAGLVMSGVIASTVWLSNSIRRKVPPPDAMAAAQEAPRMPPRTLPLQQAKPRQVSLEPSRAQVPPPAVSTPMAKGTTAPIFLELAVEMKEEGLVTVRVMNAQKREIRILFAGMLEKGNRVFAWDGRDDKGQPAPPGSYKIESQSGDIVKFKLVDLTRE